MNLLFRRIPRNFSAVRSKDLFDDLCADQIVSEPFVLEFILSPSSLGMSQNESYDLFKEANMACNMDDVFFASISCLAILLLRPLAILTLPGHRC